METVGLIVLFIVVFLLGWMTGNVIEWIMDTRERRLAEAWVAEHNKQLFLEERQERE